MVPSGVTASEMVNSDPGAVTRGFIPAPVSRSSGDTSMTAPASDICQIQPTSGLPITGFGAGAPVSPDRAGPPASRLAQ